MNIASRPPLRRLLALDRMLREGRYPNARSAAAELEVNPRTIHRDLVFLRDSWGAPLAFSHPHNGYYYQDPDYALPLLRLTEGELVALFLAERLMQQYRDSPFANDLASAFNKLTAALPEEVTIDLAHLSAAYSFRHQPAGTGAARRFRQLARAVREGRQLELVYWSASRDETSRRVVDPYHLISVEGDWYLVGYCHLREEVRMFVPGRVRSLRETGEQFDRPADFRISEYLDASFKVVRGDGPAFLVKLCFAPEAARYVRERTWHPSQRLQERRDGRLILTMKVSHLLEVKRWVLSYGAACEVLEPPELREQVEAELRQMQQSYEERTK
jgi:predicted DNA-binding transcriptional regulator YafY